LENIETAAPAPVADNAAPPPAASAQTTATNADWRSQLPDDIKNEATLSKFTDLGAFAKSYVNLERMLGAEKIPRPKGDFDPTSTEWQMYLDAGGRPKTADEYKFEEAKLPEGVEYDSQLEGKFKSVAHMAGLNNKQAAMLRDMFAAYQTEAFTAAQTEYKTQRTEAESSLQKELGSAYEPTVNAAKAALKEYADEKFVGWLEETGMGNHPEIVRVFGKIGKELLGETKLATPQSSFSTPGDYAKQAAEYRSKYTDALYNNMHPEHKLRTEELWTLTQKAYGE
jgi:hypothetical protein